MDQTDEIVRLLTEIRDDQRAGRIEGQRLYKAQEELQKTSAEETIAWYRKSIETTRANTWAMYILIALSIGFNLAVLSQISETK